LLDKEERAMIATVTTTTVLTIVSAAVTVTTLGLLAVLTLIALLITQELAGAAENRRPQYLARSLNVAILPLSVAFAAIVAAKVVEIL